MPGMTMRPSASIVRRAPESRPTSVMQPSLMPTSARRRGRPEPSTTVPPLMIVSNAMGSSTSDREADVLRLAVALERPAAAVATHPGALVAAERRFGVDHAAAVHLHGPGAQRARDAAGALEVAAPDVAVEAVLGVVRERDRLGLVAERDRADDGPEDLVSGDGHLVADAGEERRLDVPAARQVRGAAAAAGERRALAHAVGDVALDAVALRGRHERADDGVRIARVADLEPRRRGGEPRGELVVDRRLDEEPGARDADLAAVERPHLHGALQRLLGVRVRE